jgi:hypothetical protein
VATPEADLAAEFKRELAFLRAKKKRKRNVAQGFRFEVRPQGQSLRNLICEVG